MNDPAPLREQHWEAHTGDDYAVVMLPDETTDTASIQVFSDDEGLPQRIADALNAALPTDAVQPVGGEPVAWLLTHSTEPADVEIARGDREPITDADRKAGWSADALYKSSPSAVELVKKIGRLSIPEDEGYFHPESDDAERHQLFSLIQSAREIMSEPLYAAPQPQPVGGVDREAILLSALDDARKIADDATALSEQGYKTGGMTAGLASGIDRALALYATAPTAGSDAELEADMERDLTESDHEAIERSLRIVRAFGAVRDLRSVLSDTMARQHSGYDWNADPDGMTLRQSEAVAQADRAMIPAALPTDAVQPVGGVDREAVARVIDPAAFLFTPDELGTKDYNHPTLAAYRKADAILALYATAPDHSEVRTAIVKAIAFLKRDLDTDRINNTVEALLPDLVRADTILRGVKS